MNDGMKVWMVGWKRMPVECVNEMFSLIFNCKNRYVWEVKNEIKMFFLDEWRSECDFRNVKMPVFKKKIVHVSILIVRYFVPTN